MGQPITIANGNTAEISFFVKVAVRGTAPADDYVSISIDGNEIYQVFASDSASLGANYTAITKDISAYTDGSVHALLLRGEANGGSNIIFDSFTMTVDGIPTGVEDILNREKAVVVYPNPANEQINLQFNGGVAGSAVVRIYDMNGALVSVEKIMEINNRLFTMNTSSFATGIYNVEVTNGSTVIRERVNIVH
ncbi:MAG: T9SS type A sorting domain-containing protein [Crocinitomicaceae bacterium]|nr:T9SS type A sorting domain-containing protein [Crocinitomicaceae bacterium]